MDDKKLEKKLTDKKFLRENDLAKISGSAVQWIADNKTIVGGLTLVLIGIGIAIPSLKYYRMQKIDKFNAALYEAETSLKKESKFKDLLSKYADLPASQIARLKLIDSYLDHNDKEKALAEINDGLSVDSQRDIFNTLLILKKADLLKSEQKYKEAAEFMKGREAQVIHPFLGRFRLLMADLFLLAGQKEDARALYQKISVFTGSGAATDDELAEYDPVLANQAKDQILLLDLGVYK